jgi:hypothetical protein
MLGWTRLTANHAATESKLAWEESEDLGWIWWGTGKLLLESTESEQSRVGYQPKKPIQAETDGSPVLHPRTAPAEHQQRLWAGGRAGGRGTATPDDERGSNLLRAWLGAGPPYVAGDYAAARNREVGMESRPGSGGFGGREEEEPVRRGRGDGGRRGGDGEWVLFANASLRRFIEKRGRRRHCDDTVF